MTGKLMSAKVIPPTRGEERGTPNKLINIASPRSPKRIEGIAARLFILTSMICVNLLSFANSSR